MKNAYWDSMYSALSDSETNAELEGCFLVFLLGAMSEKMEGSAVMAMNHRFFYNASKNSKAIKSISREWIYYTARRIY
jgi:hypothetical protein